MKHGLVKLVAAAVLLVMTNAGADEFSFDGAWVGVQAGFNRAKNSGTAPFDANTAGAVALQGGYGWNSVGGFVLGPYAFFLDNFDATHLDPRNASISVSSNIYGLGAKLGYPINNFLPYLKVAYAETVANGVPLFSRQSGFLGGLGLEVKLTPNWSLSAEYTYTAPIDNTGDRFTNQNFMLGVSYYFEGVYPWSASGAAETQEKPKPAPASKPAQQVQAQQSVQQAQPTQQQLQQAQAAAQKQQIISRPMRLEGANFAPGGDKILPGAASTLDMVAKTAKQYPDMDITVEGHTDNVGKKAANQKLSERRAAAVKQQLVKRGVDAKRIQAIGYGETRPVADNKTAAGRKENRRVEIHYTIREMKLK
jgi:OOP family OmpA-OmpF porin